MNPRSPLLPDIKENFSSLSHLFSDTELRELIAHDSIRVYYTVSLSETGFSLSELPTTTARADIILDALRTLLRDYGTGVSLLDLACSPGYFMFKIAELGIPDITGVDARLVHFKQFRLLNNFYRYQNVKFIHADMYEFLEEEIRLGRKYDICLLFGFLYHTPTPVELLQKIHCLCRKCLIIDTTLNFGASAHLNIFKEETSWSRASTSSISFMPSLRAVPCLLSAAGYRHIQRYIPPHAFKRLNPGGDNIDYYFDQVRIGGKYVSGLKRITKGILYNLHIIKHAPRGIFIAHSE